MEKDLHEAIEKHDAEHRLLCALDGRPYQTPSERQKIALLLEALGRGAPITEALAGLREGRAPASTRIVRHGDPHAPLPAGIEQRLAEALTANPRCPTASRRAWRALSKRKGHPMTTTPTTEMHESTAPPFDAPAIAHLTVEEWERVESLLPAVDALLRRMAADGVTDPVTVLRAAVDAGRDAAEAPILALARHVDPEAIRWAPEIEYLRVVNDLADGVRLRLVIHACLDQIARVGGGRARGS